MKRPSRGETVQTHFISGFVNQIAAEVDWNIFYGYIRGNVFSHVGRSRMNVNLLQHLVIVVIICVLEFFFVVDENRQKKRVPPQR